MIIKSKLASIMIFIMIRINRPIKEISSFVTFYYCHTYIIKYMYLLLQLLKLPLLLPRSQLDLNRLVLHIYHLKFHNLLDICKFFDHLIQQKYQNMQCMKFLNCKLDNLIWLFGMECIQLMLLSIGNILKNICKDLLQVKSDYLNHKVCKLWRHRMSHIRQLFMNIKDRLHHF